MFTRQIFILCFLNCYNIIPNVFGIQQSLTEISEVQGRLQLSDIINSSQILSTSEDLKILCYYDFWSSVVIQKHQFRLQDMDQSLCTHIIFGSVSLDFYKLLIKAPNLISDYNKTFVDKVTTFKNMGYKVILSLGGWDDSGNNKYSRLIKTRPIRLTFITNVIQFIEKHNFDGLDLDWEFPICWQENCNKGPKTDKEGFANLIKELYAKFQRQQLLLTATVSSARSIIDKAYDFSVMTNNLDWITVLTYDYHGPWDNKTGHIAPLYSDDYDEMPSFNANYSINYWIFRGFPRRKIIMGIPFYGRTFSIDDPSAGTGLNVRASVGREGEFTKSPGMLAYYEICNKIQNENWTIVQDRKKHIGPYAFKGKEWISFDDIDMIKEKTQFIERERLGGGMIYSLNFDDVQGKCADGRFPLLKTLKATLTEIFNNRTIKND